MKLLFSARPPFSLDAVVRSHGWAQLAPFRRDDDERTLRYVSRLDAGRVVELLIREETDGVSVATDAPLSGAEQAQVERQVAWMLGLDQDLSAFHDLARREPRLAHVVERAQGRLLRSPTLFEDAVKTILTTNTTWAGTIRMVEALVARFGDPLPADPGRHAFPSPGSVAAADVETLRSETRLGYRAPYVLELARSVASGDLDLEGFRSTGLPTPQLRKELLAIKGVGAYAAAHLLILLERYDFLPVDSWALKMVSHEWHGGEPIGPAEVEAAFQPWGAWKGLAYWFWAWSYSGEA
jgi:3-methyladenine DNA glycosylase/8-oxoguanine DNA glycosylase